MKIITAFLLKVIIALHQNTKALPNSSSNQPFQEMVYWRMAILLTHWTWQKCWERAKAQKDSVYLQIKYLIKRKMYSSIITNTWVQMKTEHLLKLMNSTKKEDPSVHTMATIKATFQHPILCLKCRTTLFRFQLSLILQLKRFSRIDYLEEVSK